ncbi:mucin-5AC-like [Macrobrachium nipponense]|uniref:mucin-5AC-like n=1 Tax=Macrobrachium nipponense TaxID=159736 RepID=UPI0030C7CB9C
MRTQVISIFLIALLTGKSSVQGRAQDPATDEKPPETGDGPSDVPDMEAEDTHKRFIIAEPPPVRENPHHQRNYVRWGHQANRRPNLPWQTSPRTPTSKRNQNPALRLHSFPGPYPFESEVRGEGYHSRIRFDPFGGAYPESGPRPVGQTFGNWPARPPNGGIREGGTHRPLLQPFHNQGKFLSNAENARLPPFSDPDHFHQDPPRRHPTFTDPLHENPTGTSTYHPLPERPFLHPGNLAALVEDGNIEAPSPSVTEEFPAYEESTIHDELKPDFDYPVVASVFDDRPKPDVISGPIISIQDQENDTHVDEEATSPSAGANAEEEGLNTTEKDLEIHPSLLATSNSSSTQTYDQAQQSNDTEHEPVPADYTGDYYDLYDEFMELYYDNDEFNQSTHSNTTKSTATAHPDESAPLPASDRAISSTTESVQNLSHQTEETTSSATVTPTSHSSLATSTTKIEPLSESTRLTIQSTIPPSTSTTTEITTTSTTGATEETTTSTSPPVTTTENIPVSTVSDTPSPSISLSRDQVNPDDDQKEKESKVSILNTDTIKEGQISTQEAEDAARSTNTPLATNNLSPGTNKGSSLISLSEILQGIGMSLPQFLIALKGHGMALKDFTARLQEKSLTQQQFKRAEGNLESLLQMLSNDSEATSETAEDLPPKEEGSEADKKVSLVPYWLTPRPTWRPTTASTSAATTTTSTTTESTTTTQQPSTSAPPPKIFGFNPSVQRKNIGAANNKTIEESTESPDEGTKAPIPIKLDIAGIMKEKGLSAADILHDLGSLFTFGNDSTSTDKTTDQATLKKEDSSTGDGALNAANDDEETFTSTQTPYTVPDTPVSLRPYRPSGGSERHRPRPYRPSAAADRGWGGTVSRNRNILTNRFQTTERTTLRPPYQPPPVKQSSDISPLLDILHNSTTSSDGGSISFGLPDENEVAGIPFSENTPPRYSSGNYFPSKDDDPDSLNVSTKSAILAASILGGVAMCIFLAILVVVMYRGRARRRKPLSIPSDASSSSTPPIYSSRVGSGKGFYKTSGFWGTLKKRFDPYSLSPTPTVMT